MKIKKLLVIISMLAVMFSLSGCGDEVKDKPFNYSDKEIVLSTMKIFDGYNAIPESNYDLAIANSSEIDSAAIKGIRQAKQTDKVGDFEDFSMYYNNNLDPEEDIYSITNEESYVMVTVKNHAENRVVDVQAKYIENIDYTMQFNQYSADKDLIISTIEEQNGITFEDFLESQGVSSFEEMITATLAKQGMTPYVLDEIVISPVYSRNELIGQAGMNTLIGMGTVFCVLIFISFIISLLKFLPALFSGKKKVEEVKPAPATVKASQPVVETADEDLMNDEELVAVIMAAIKAASSDNAVYTTQSNDTLVVRSIRRANRR